MATLVIIQKMGQQMESGTIVKWFVEEGDYVNESDLLFEMETDKVTAEVSAPVSGFISRLNGKIGLELPVGETVAYIMTKEELAAMETGKVTTEISTLVSGTITGLDTGIEAELPNGETIDNTMAKEEQSTKSRPLEGKRINASPYARRLSREHNINLAEITVTAAIGRITAQDVYYYLKNQNSNKEIPTILPEDYSSVQHAIQKEVPLNSMRKAIVSTVQKSARSIVPVTITRTVRVDKLVQLRQELKNEGLALSPNDFIIFAVSRALQKFNNFNSVFAEDRIIQYEEINIGFAVAVNNGLMIPVIHHSNKKSVGEIAGERKKLVELARNQSLTKESYESGTFSISSLGEYGVDSFSPVVYPTQTAILGVGAIKRKPIIEKDDQLGIGYLLKLSLVFDHRVTDGVPAAEFLNNICEWLEYPLRMLI